MKNYDKHSRPFETDNHGFVEAIINLCRNQSNPLREPGNEPDYSSLIEEVIFEAQLKSWKRFSVMILLFTLTVLLGL